MTEYEYDVALSFAGADREIARVLGETAVENGLRVFYDEFYLSELWGKNLVEELQAIYTERARYCVLLVSEEYCRKPYTIAERRFALDRAIRQNGEYILPIVLDDAWPEGIPRTIAFVDLRETSIREVANLLIQKIRSDNQPLARPSESVFAPKLVPTSKSELDLNPATGTPGLTIAMVKLAEECDAWKQTGDFDFFCDVFEDPTFDITLFNRAESPVLLTAVGMEFVELGTNPHAFGAVVSEPVLRHRVYRIELPDLWTALAEATLRSQDKAEKYPARELAMCRLPDPVLMAGKSAYRFGLHLGDYIQLCPDHAGVHFWARTDRGELRSPRANLRYILGGDYGGLPRYDRILRGEGDRTKRIERLAYAQWESAGRPPGQDVLFWASAEARVDTDTQYERLKPRPLD